MKEATGEATNTVVTIVLIGLVLSLGGLIIKTVMDNISNKANDATTAECDPTTGECH